MLEFPGYEYARRRGAMSSDEIEDKWNKAFGKKLTWLDRKKIVEVWERLLNV